MLVAREVEVRAGAQLLLSPVAFQVISGDKIGLVGRNGAGKTTLTRILAGEALPAAGEITRTGQIGYLPQDPRTGDLEQLAKDRILSARGLDSILRRLSSYSMAMSTEVGQAQEKAMNSYSRAEAELAAAGGYGAESEAARIAANLGLADRVLSQPLRTLSGGQRRRVELARILFSGAETLLLDEPTNHLDADSIVWLRGFLQSYSGGLIVISHDVGLLEACVNKVFHLDANRAELDIYSMDWKRYLLQRETDQKRRKRERANAERKAETLQAQANKMRAKATKAVAAQNMAKRAEKLLAGLEDHRAADRVAKIRLPKPAPSGKTPLTATELSKSYGSLEVFTDVDLAIDRGSKVVILGLNGAGKTTLLRLLAGIEESDTGRVIPGHGLRLGYYAQEHETLDVSRSVLENMITASPELNETEVRKILGSFLFSGDDVEKPARVLSGGEKTRLALAMLVVSAANVLLLDEPTNNLDPASRAEVLAALRDYAGAVVLVTHDEGAVTALEPDRVLLLPDGDEDLWNPEYLDLVSLA
ncbi:ABC-F family ATP-binding cassette domain-containing protein [Propionicimonas sp.]|uniref:ABC-F family ATP-binding cassette domain-containing protein n=1 Tax=Propionicimonas sp. TaxID=1955623 RepID=UPI001843611C|nr:ABC-F family ATP-binding cassette domain-containing protein [Propionicimonas sp.]MBU3977588.1 ATP-binding cassette domain-containing protein [Actinomycetota bacterium]MBA3021513.1 ABC-F family ATP-binding cassette domain-containing protein [Propionicimonas sp.]MBU3987062.1 ATP-binding cassette domain-containing protein [Actinomycetota bacterium]MBU4008883.1 ATP-binding cassette domain-containing protein [Actinomycetota bacterium]MBU4065967.1 ATP-binding cassette domain-containing protein [A